MNNLSEGAAHIAFEQHEIAQTQTRLAEMRQRAHQIIGRGVLALGLSLGAIGIDTTMNAEQADAASCGQVLISGDDWLGGDGVSVRSNGAQQTTGASCAGETQIFNLDRSPAQYGYGWQCFELMNRLYAQKGWTSYIVRAGGNGGAKNLYPNARAGQYPGLSAKANGSGYKPVPGDMIIHDSSNPSGYGHVSIVDRIEGNKLFAVEQNSSENGWAVYNYNSQTGAVSKSNTIIPGYVHAEKNNGPQAKPAGSKGKRSDFNGNGNSDLLLYKPGGADYVWQGHDQMGEFGEHRMYIGEDFKIAVGDFNGNKRADFVAYGLGTAPDYIFYGQEEPGEFKKVPLQIDGFYNQVVPGDFDGDGFDDLMLYAEGGEDRVWHGTPNAARFEKHSLNVQLGGGYQITSGTYNNNRNGDLFLYNPNGEDFVLSGQDRRGSYAFTKHRVNAQQDIPFARPVSGDFNGDGHDDVFMHGPNETPDYVLYGLATSGDFHRSQIELNKDYTPIATGDYNGDGKDDVYLQSPQADRNQLLSGTKEKGNFTGYMKAPGVTYQPIST